MFMRTRFYLFAVVLFGVSVLRAPADTAVKCSIKTLSACPQIGCSKPGTPLATTNSQKRTAAINGSPMAVSFGDLRDLQQDVDGKFASGPIVVAGQKR
jgi:hypothetical protein